MVGARGIEPRASTVSRWRSTPELCARRTRASNRKKSLTQGPEPGALPSGRDHAFDFLDEVFEMEWFG